MNSITMSFGDGAEMNAAYARLKRLYPKNRITKSRDAAENVFLDASVLEGAPQKQATQEEFMQAMAELNGSIDDPTFADPPEMECESPREAMR
ncbi:MAG: hypothetical protein FWH48_00955 [Oscillospiraceae bacterium]|nr:hypothetical protein [Oscillospiraceae bacterium]